MLVHLLFASAVAAAYALQKSGPSGRTCGDSDCFLDFEAHPPGASDLAFGDHVCQCCWRDCDLKSEKVLHVESLHKRTVEDDVDTSEVDAWLLMAHWKQHLEWNMYTPVLETVKTALESKGSVTRIIGLMDLYTMIAGVKRAVANGRRPLVLSVAHKFAGPNKDEKCKVQDLIKQAKQAGAYVVAYQSEPAFNRWGVDGSLVQLAYAEGMAGNISADEIWDYSRAHTANYPPGSKYPPLDDSVIIRYVPPGYSPKMDVGVDVNSPLLNVSAIGYLGGRKPKSHRYAHLLDGRFRPTNGIWSDAALRAYMETYAFQLNQHKEQTCCPREGWEDETMHIEAFRMSALLANKACVISAPASLKDMQEFEGMVTFAEVEDTASAMERLSKDLAGCRARTYETYKRVFAPERILENSGFFQTWLPPHGK